MADRKLYKTREPLKKSESSELLLDFNDDRGPLGAKPAARRHARAQRGGAAAVPGETTADDLEPETLLDDDGIAIPSEALSKAASDTVLNISGSDAPLGFGSGLDEAELAGIDPVGRDVARALRDKVAAHARDPNAVEPAEAEMRRQMQAAKNRAQRAADESG